jgi:hypothetical protein
LRDSEERVRVKETAMHTAIPMQTKTTRRPEGLSGSWCILGSQSLTCVRDSLPTPSYPASPNFARKQEAGT